MSASRSVEVLVVSPGAGVRLATVDGRPVVRVEVVEDARATLATLDVALAASVGGATRAFRSDRSAPARREHRIMGPVAGRAPGVAVRDGRLVVELPIGVDLSAFRRELLEGLGRVAATHTAAATPRDRLRPASGDRVERAWPRRSPSDAASAPCCHLLDLGREAWLLYWIAVAARLAAIAAEAS